MSEVIYAVTLVLEAAKELAKSYHFSNQLGFYAAHLENQVLVCLRDAKGNFLGPETKRTLDAYCEKLRSLQSKVKKFQNNFVRSAILNKQEEISDDLNQLSHLERKLLLLLHAKTSFKIEEVLDKLKEARKADSVIASNLERLRGDFRLFVEGEEKRLRRSLKEGDLMAYFGQLSDDLSRQGTSSPWIQTSADFRALLGELKSCSYRYKHLRLVRANQRGEVGSVEYIELIKQQVLNMLDHLQVEVPRFPKNFLGQAKDSIKHLEDVRSRVEDLCLTVSFVGPVKSGKSTAINAILGVELFPSDTLPCTVMPTTIRHTDGRRTPRLLITSKQRNVFQVAFQEIQVNHREIRSIGGLPRRETECLDEIVSGRTALEPAYNGVASIRKALWFMNQTCRLYARAKQAEKVVGENPLSDLVNGKGWPTIEVEMEFLRNLQMTGNFEIVDSPGRDETTLIPEIEQAVVSAMQASAAVVCVLDVKTAFTDSARTIRRELTSALTFRQPVFILANKIDDLPRGESVTYHEELIGKQYLKAEYDASTRQVFGVSAKSALNMSLLSRSLDTSEKVKAVRALPDIVDESEGTGLRLTGTSPVFDRDQIFAIIEVFIDMHGDLDWMEKAEDYTEKVRDRQLQRLETRSRFEPFRDKLIRELAPRAGQKVLRDQIEHVLSGLKSLAADMDIYIDMMLMGEEGFRFRQKKLKAQLIALRHIVEEQVPRILQQQKLEISNALRATGNELSTTLKTLVKEAFGSMRGGALGEFRVEPPPSIEEMKKYQHLQQVAGQEYFQAISSVSHRLLDGIRMEVQRCSNPAFEDCLLKHLKILKDSSAGMRKRFLGALKADIDGLALDAVLANVAETLPSPKPPMITPPSASIGKTSIEREKVRRWYVLWTLKRWKATGNSILVVPLKQAQDLYTEQVATLMVQLFVENSMEVCVDHLQGIADQIVNQYKRKVAAIQQLLKQVEIERATIEKNRKGVVGVARSRMILECVSTELYLMMAQAEAGANVEELLVQLDLNDREGMTDTKNSTSVSQNFHSQKSAPSGASGESKMKLKGPADMSVQELKAAVRNAGLGQKAVGFLEKSEFAKLLESHRESKN